MNLPGLFKDNYSLIVSCNENEVDDCSKMVSNALFMDEKEVMDKLLYGLEVPKLYRDIALSKRSKLLRKANELNLESVSIKVQDKHKDNE